MTTQELELQLGFRIHGFFEELLDERGKFLGTRRVELDAARPIGVQGRQEHVFTDSFLVSRGANIATLKASLKKPVRCHGHVYPICGARIASPSTAAPPAL